ncbi:MAG: phosphoglucomutase/phosphomannomutase family protein [Vulcanimicrobiota bacterium]
MSNIKFGTDGWRSIMCENFTFPNVEIVVQGICNYLKDNNKDGQGLVIGYDTRFFSDRFARRAAQVCAGNGINVFLTENDCPTPVTAYSILHQGSAGALMFTASHNPPEYNGIKFIPENAAPALPEVTNQIETWVRKVEESKEIKKVGFEDGRSQGLIKFMDPTKAYMDALKKVIDLSTIARGNLKVIYDPLYATGRSYVPLILSDITDFTMIHPDPDPYFGGSMPEPKGEILGELIHEVTTRGADLGLANDGDADRFGVVDSNGVFISPNQVISLIYLHLLKNRGLVGSIARTVATTHLVDRIAEKYDSKVIETPVGFKYIGNALLRDDVIIGGEESGGLSIEGHIPEKDGILALALITEIRSVEKKSLTELLQEMYDEFGAYYSTRIDIHSTEEHKLSFFDKLNRGIPDNIAGMNIIRHNDIDGHKFYLEDGSWVLYRPSGTEPLVRIYMEAHSRDRLDKLAKDAEAIFMNEKIPTGA